MSKIHIGVSGWQYDGWCGEFYPEELPKRRQLEYATRLLGAVEVNGTFYSLKSPETFAHWYETSAADAVLAIKGSRYVTHTRRLRDPKTALGNFFANGLLRLEDKLGPILWQLPPKMKWDREVFERFCELLPRDTEGAARLGRAHDDRVAGKVSLSVERNRNLRHAFELRDARMVHDDALKTLRQHGHALVFADTGGRYPFCEDITAGFIYVRLHGAEELYASGYDDDALRWWGRRIERWASGGEMKTGKRISDRAAPRRKSRDVYAFFDNDARVHAPFDALTLHRLVGQPRDPYAIRDEDGRPLPAPPRIQRGADQVGRLDSGR